MRAAPFALPTETDAFVVGGGPAGLAAAIAIRRKGFRVVVADSAAPSIDKACGEGLMPDSLDALRALGIAGIPEQSWPFRGIRFVEDGRSADAGFPHGSGLGIRRTRLHALLAGCAADAGVGLFWGAQVRGLAGDGVLVEGREVRCRWVIGADGENSRVRDWAGLKACRYTSRRYGFRKHYRIAPWTDCVEIHWGTGCQIYITPVGSDEVCVAVLARDPRSRLEDVLPAFPEVARRLVGAPSSSRQRGAVTASRALKRVATDKVALIGDASGSVDAITGEGLCLSFRQALALATAIEYDDFPSYAHAHRCVMRRPSFMGALMLLLDRSPKLRHQAMWALSAKPEVFAGLLAIHVGAPPALADLLRCIVA